MTHLRANDALRTSNATKATAEAHDTQTYDIAAYVADAIELESVNSVVDMVYDAWPEGFTEYFLREILAKINDTSTHTTDTSVTIHPHQDYYPISGNELPYDPKWIDDIIDRLRGELRMLGYITNGEIYIHTRGNYSDFDFRGIGEVRYYKDYLVVDWSNATEQ